ncbi:hypothetical protein HRE53_27545 (plasmid) [Acaryochloris sp. 'Moss Beach']|uniref:hypothetical protein n=1 Tax=Acaryochloris sp. 'Moss Beach' TaxID=2740837 RepID=UPI001F16A97A|nr:hypothetical protein [Acaryochloris sp. 'Moss Beach']UJB72345.1 hypothetical protein HRE53_27545 [Acaryochloris sp. 'Moss Beach']
MFIFAFRVKKGQEPTLTDDMAWSGLKGGTAAVTGATGIDFKSYWHIHRSADEPMVQLADEYETSNDPPLPSFNPECSRKPRPLGKRGATRQK